MNSDWLLKRARGAYSMWWVIYMRCGMWLCPHKSPTLLDPDISGRICALRRRSRTYWQIGWQCGDEGLPRSAAGMGQLVSCRDDLCCWLCPTDDSQ